MHFSSALLALGVAKTAVAGYSLADDYSGSNFFNNFDFWTGHDPTNGFVNYVDQGTASSSGLINTDNNQVYMGVDSTNKAPNGRSSVRVTSKKSYTHMLVVLDLAHMPYGCGTWPAFWTVGPNWPSSGEIDIIEGVNDATSNTMTLHANSDCSISGGSQALLQPASTDCNALADGNQGCGFKETATSTYGAGLNSAGGGTFAMEWTSSGVSIWRWGHGSAPSDALGSNPNPSGWGSPSAQWGGGGCNWDGDFSNHQIVFDNTFCGDWAGNAFQSCSAANNGQTCNDFVANNPESFKDAFWSVNALKVYQTDGSSDNNQQPTAAQTQQPQPQQSAQPSAQPSPASPSPSPSPQETQPSPAPSSSGNDDNNNNSGQPLQEGSDGSIGWAANPPSGGGQSQSGQPLTSDEFGQGSQGIPTSKRSVTDAGQSARRMKRHLREHIRRQHQSPAF